MSLIPLYPGDVLTDSTPYYNESNFTPSTIISQSSMGWSVDITSDSTVAVASQSNYFYNKNGGSPGLAEYVYIYYQDSEGLWAEIPDGPIENPTPANYGNYFGISVSLSHTNGEFLAIGTWASDLVYIYKSNLATPPTYSAVAISPIDLSEVGDGTYGFNLKFNNAGNILYVVNEVGDIKKLVTINDWAMAPTITELLSGLSSTTESDNGAQIGLSVSDTQGTVARGLPLYDGGSDYGRVEIISSSLTIAQPIIGTVAGRRIGGAVALSENGLYLAFSETGDATLNTPVADSDGKVYVYTQVGGGGTYTQQTDPPIEAGDVNDTAGTNSGSFGYSLALNPNGNLLAIGDAYSASFKGDVYLFERNDDDWSLEQDSFGSIVSSTLETRTITTGVNDTLIIDDTTDAEQTTTITPGSRTGSVLAADLETAINIQMPTSTYTVTFNSGEGKFTITNTTNPRQCDIFTSTLASEMGYTTPTGFAVSHVSDSVSEWNVIGSLVGTSIASSDAQMTNIVIGKPGYLLNQGIMAIVERSTESVIRNERLIIDVNSNTALNVRKNNDAGDVFTVDTILEEVTCSPTSTINCGDIVSSGTISGTFLLETIEVDGNFVVPMGNVIVSPISDADLLLTTGYSNTVEGYIIDRSATSDTNSDVYAFFNTSSVANGRIGKVGGGVGDMRIVNAVLTAEEGIAISTGKDLTTEKIIMSQSSVISNKRTGTQALSDDLDDQDVDDLDFTTNKMFSINCFVEIATTYWSNYHIVGVNESNGGTTWVITVTRTGTPGNDPQVTFNMNAGQLRCSTANLGTGNLYYDLISNIE